jgi:hypothetical protein
MARRSLVLMSLVGMLLVLAAVLPVPVVSQGAKPYSPPRMPDGHPDLQGTYDLATLTPLERPAGLGTVMTREEVAKRERAVATQVSLGAQPIRGDREAPPKGGDGSAGAAGNVGGYNSFWLDPGSTYTIVNGQIRTSLIVDPPDGRMPALTPAARQRVVARLLGAGTGTPQVNDRGLETAPGAYDDPERRPLGERCLLGFGSTSGPPALPNYFYNNLHRIVQTPNTVLILNEMVHDARMVRMNAQHLPKHIRKWMGDSVGRWEGDTLVVDTTNFNGDQIRYAVDASPGRRLLMVESLGSKTQDRVSGPSQDLHVIERFTRVADNALLYRFTVENPATWVAPWTGEYTWPSTNEQIYEYACHEANYALENVLRGARQREADAGAKP